MKSWRPGSGGSHSSNGPGNGTAGPGPGKHTLTESLEPVRRSSTDAPAHAAGSTDDTGVVGPQGGAAPAAVSRAIESSSGAALPTQARAALESSYGADLGGVRVHTSSESAAAASSIGARAFAHGRDVHFAGGEYSPGSPGGFSLLAHEVAHTVQSGPSSDRAQAKLEIGATGDAAEVEADRAAAAAVRGDRFSIERASSAVGRAIRRVDQREGTAIPTAATQSAIASELFPAASSASGASAPWDGATGQPNAATNRTALINEMHTAMTAFLTARMNGPTGINAVAAQPRVPIASLEGAGQAAKADADAHFSSWASAAALTTVQETARASYSISASGPGQNLFDAQNPADRAHVGMAINPADLASWISETAPACVTALQTHHLDRTRGADERNFLRTRVLAPWTAAHDADLRLFDQHGFAMSNPDTGQIVLPTSVPLGLSTTSPGAGVPPDAERSRKWLSWRTMVHEYIHQLEHPRLQTWPRHNRTISEGFCELFTKEVLLPLLPTAAGADVARRTRIEGGDFGPPSAAIIGGPYSSGSYAGYVSHVENIQSHLGGAAIGAQNAMKAVFFQGHIEYLGFDQAGNPLTAPAGPQDQITAPATITTFAALAAAVNVPEADLRAANPGVSEPLSGRLHAPGCREHRVVTSSDATATRAETRAVIAKQNGVTEAALTTANSGVNWAALAADQIIIIPRH